MRKPAVYTARKLRRSMSLPEAMLWQQLRSKKLGFKVRRQHPLGPYVIDFYVREEGLVIEIDGEAHNRGDQPSRDSARDEFLKHNGYRVLRIAAVDVLKNIDGVIEGIAAQVTNPLHHASQWAVRDCWGQSRLPPIPPHAGEDL